MPNILISIVVPVYNVENYVLECLDSLAKQSYHNIEVIVVNDGSTDGSAEICRAFCDSDNRFVLVNQRNQGLGPARNTGINISKGEYICFVDSDDYVHKNYVEDLYNAIIIHNADMAMCNYEKVYSFCELNEPCKKNYSALDKKEILRRLSTSGPANESECMVVAWNKMVKAEIMKGLKYNNCYHEDEFMINDLLLRTKKIVWTDSSLYYYRQRDNGITGIKKDIRHLDVLKAYKERIVLFSGREYKKIYPAMVKNCLDNCEYWYYVLNEKSFSPLKENIIIPIYGWTLIHSGKHLWKNGMTHYIKFFGKLVISKI